MSAELQQSSSPGGAEIARPSLKGMKVLHVGKYYPPYMGGIETHLQALSRELAKTVDLRVIVSSDGHHASREVLDGVNLLRVATPLKVFSTPLSPAMVSAIRHSAADLIHIHLPNPTAVMAYLASGHRGKAIFTYHSDTVKQKVLGSMFQPLLDAALRRSSAVIATSPNYLATSPVLATVRDRCHVIPYGIDLTQFEQSDPAEVEQVRHQYGERLIISVGRLVYYKGFEFLIRAMTRVNGKLLIVGTGPLRTDLERLASELGIADKVVLVGEIQNERVIPYYHAAQIFALASVARSEAFGIVQIEAMASGLPVVNTALDSGVPFVSLDGQTGLTVAPADADAMAAALNRLLDDAELRRRLGSAGIRRARQEFSLDTMVGRTLDLYRTVLRAS